MDISVVIVTYNRAVTLRKTLSALAGQQGMQHMAWEVILVDHNCTDETDAVVQEFLDRPDIPLKVIHETHPSVSECRNAGIRESQGHIVAFTDDDVIPDHNWVRSICDNFKKFDCRALGGKVLPIYPAQTPRWIKEHKQFLNGPIVYRDEGQESHFYNEGMLPFVGANMAVRRDCLKACGYFDPNLGPGTDIPVGGEDVEIFRNLEGAGRILYSAETIIHHLHSPERMRLSYISRWYFRHGYSIVKKHPEKIIECRRCLAGIPAYLYKEGFYRCRTLITNCLKRKECLFAWCKMAWIIGYCMGAREMRTNR